MPTAGSTTVGHLRSLVRLLGPRRLAQVAGLGDADCGGKGTERLYTEIVVSSDE